MDLSYLGFPPWICICHFVNILFLTLLMRSGIQILYDHPRLYMNDHCAPNSEWLKFTKKKVPTDCYYTSMDDAKGINKIVALPGGFHNLGLGRHWHFFSVIFWVLNGLIYVALLFGTGQWKRIIPSSWEMFPLALEHFWNYLTFHIPHDEQFQPYGPLRQVTYSIVIFIMAPLAILTGIAMSPAFIGRFTWYPKLFGGRQKARSLHFIILVLYLLFLIVHVTMVAIRGFAKNMNDMFMGGVPGYEGLGLFVGLFAIAVIIGLHIFATKWSEKNPRSVQVTTGYLMDKAQRFFFYKRKSKQNYSKADISPHFWVNGYPPDTKEWLDLAKDNFANYKLEVKGLVSNPLFLSLEDLRSMPKSSQITLHNCIQGWSGIAQWAGVSLEDLMKRCSPLPNAKYVVFHSYQFEHPGVEYYSTLEIEEALQPQCILAYEMNEKPLSIPHGAPLRLRIETKLGFKMTKWIKCVEFVADYKTVGLGYGGYREDRQWYSKDALI